jgi:hypothetical protein
MYDSIAEQDFKEANLQVGCYTPRMFATLNSDYINYPRSPWDI